MGDEPNELNTTDWNRECVVCGYRWRDDGTVDCPSCGPNSPLGKSETTDDPPADFGKPTIEELDPADVAAAWECGEPIPGTDQPQTTPRRRLILDLDEKSITFEPPLPLPFTGERGGAYDEMMAALSVALTKFGEACP